MKTIFENDLVKISRPGRDYAFVGKIENKANRTIRIIFINEEIDSFSIKPDDWVGIFTDDNGYSILEEFTTGNFIII